VCFNAHRVHDPRDVAAAFGELELIEFAGVDDAGASAATGTSTSSPSEAYACGMYLLERPRS
jgi:hypothetical protein